MSRESEGLQLNPLLNSLILKMESLLPKLRVLASCALHCRRLRDTGRKAGFARH